LSDASPGSHRSLNPSADGFTQAFRLLAADQIIAWITGSIRFIPVHHSAAALDRASSSLCPMLRSMPSYAR